MAHLEKRARVVFEALLLAGLLAGVRWETEVFISSAEEIIGAGLWMGPLIFAHNSLAATAVMVALFVFEDIVELLPPRFKRGDAVAKHPRAFSALFAILLIFGSFLQKVSPAQILQTAQFWLPVAALEAYGLYLAALTGLRRKLRAKGVAAVYTTFLISAILEAGIIASIVS